MVQAVIFVFVFVFVVLVAWPTGVNVMENVKTGTAWVVVRGKPR